MYNAEKPVITHGHAESMELHNTIFYTHGKYCSVRKYDSSQHNQEIVTKTLYHLRAGSGQKTTLRTYICFDAPAYGAATCVLQDVFSSLPSFSEHLASSFLSQQANGGFAG